MLEGFMTMARSCFGRFYIREVRGDLFTCPSDTSMAHCISEDVNMGKGIAVAFKTNFGGVLELRSQGKKPGEVSVLKREKRFIYYLVTKSRYYHTPTYETLQDSLKAMRRHCKEHEVKKLAIPKIGCGLDKLDWRRVKVMIEETFKDTDVEITVYSL